MNAIPDSPVEVEHGSVPVDSGRLLIIDPCNLPADLVAQVTTPNAYGVTVGVLVGTPTGDGWYPVWSTPGTLSIDDPYAGPEATDQRPWLDLTSTD